MSGSSGSSLEHIAARAAARFVQRFGRSPTALAASPGRVNLIGEHTDYNDGWVFPMGIDRYTVVAADRAVGAAVTTIASTHRPQLVTVDLERPHLDALPRWARYVVGVLALCAEGERAIGPHDLLIESSVPLGAGLSSSAALEVAVATLIEGVTEHPFSPIGKARLCQRAEHAFAGVPCGLMDQLACVLAEPGHAMLIDCQSVSIEQVAMPRHAVRALLISSGVQRRLDQGVYARRRAECRAAAETLGVSTLRAISADRLEDARGRLDPTLYRRVQHVVTENDRTLAAAAALGRGDWAEAGRHLFASHASLRNDFEVSCPELDALVDDAGSIGDSSGVYGCRLTGGGLGGYVVALVDAPRAKAIGAELADRQQRRTGSRPDYFVTDPVGAARRVTVPHSGQEPDPFPRRS